MSYTTILEIHKSGDVQHGPEYRNAWGSAASVWTALCSRYGLGVGFLAWDKCFDLQHSDSLLLCEQYALRWTFDGAVTLAAEFLGAARLLDQFTELHRPAGPSVWHLGAIAEHYRQCARRPEIIGLAVNQTSVSDTDNFMCGVRDDDGKYVRPYNVFADKRHHEITIATLPCQEHRQ